MNTENLKNTVVVVSVLLTFSSFTTTTATTTTTSNINNYVFHDNNLSSGWSVLDGLISFLQKLFILGSSGLVPGLFHQVKAQYWRWVPYTNYPRIPTPYWKPARDHTNEDDYALREFKDLLGSDAEYIYDDIGAIIGITLNKSTKRHDGSAGDNTYRAGQENRGDQDVCCSTQETWFLNDTLNDSKGYTRTISQKAQTGSHQFIRHGYCGTLGLCRGKCVITPVYLSLAVIDRRYSFRFFKLPGYCTCKEFG